MEFLQTAGCNCFAQVSNALTLNNSSLEAPKPHCHSAMPQPILSAVRWGREAGAQCPATTSAQLPAALHTTRLEGRQRSSHLSAALSVPWEADLWHRGSTLCIAVPWHPLGWQGNQSISFHLRSPWEVGLQSLSAKKQSASHMILQTWSCPRGKKNYALLPLGAEMLYVLLIRRLSSQSSLRHLTLYHDSTLQHCIYPSFQHTGGRAHFFCNSGECHLHKKSSSKSFYSITNVICIEKTEDISLDWK